MVLLLKGCLFETAAHIYMVRYFKTGQMWRSLAPFLGLKSKENLLHNKGKTSLPLVL